MLFNKILLVFGCSGAALGCLAIFIGGMLPFIAAFEYLFIIGSSMFVISTFIAAIRIGFSMINDEG